MLIRLADIAHARSADKADWVDFGLFAWNPAGYTVLARVDCWPLPNLLAIKLVLHDALQGGSARNLRRQPGQIDGRGLAAHARRTQRHRVGAVPGRAARGLVAASLRLSLCGQNLSMAICFARAR